jgi:hypothetical protein
LIFLLQHLLLFLFFEQIILRNDINMQQLHVLLPLDLAQLGNCSEVDDEGGAVTDAIGVYLHVTSHFGDEMFADGEAEACSLLVAVLAVAHHVELDKKFFLIS